MFVRSQNSLARLHTVGLLNSAVLFGFLAPQDECWHDRNSSGKQLQQGWAERHGVGSGLYQCALREGLHKTDEFSFCRPDWEADLQL